MTLVAVTKFFPASDVDLLAGLGVRDIGENRDQEASAKVAELAHRDRLTVHFIGQLQSNKAGSVARYADVVHSLDRAKIARALDRAAEREDRVLDVLVQVGLDAAGGRGGAEPDDVRDLADVVGGLEHVRLRGLMAVAPLGEEPRPAFARLRALAEAVRADHPGATWCVGRDERRPRGRRRGRRDTPACRVGNPRFSPVPPVTSVPTQRP